MIKRALEIVVISDVHLGAYACHSAELLQYLKSIQPKILVLNGDIIDAWHFKRNALSSNHLEIIDQLLEMVSGGTKIYYLSGNHDDIIRGYSPFNDEKIILRNHLEFVIDQKKYWIFHGDIFDASVSISPWIARLGLISYKYLIRINRLLDKIRKPRLSLTRRMKSKVKRALKYIHDFEDIVARHALKKEYDVVICGHIHVPVIKKMLNGQVIYMNAGDWVENLTALEYQHHQWSLYRYDSADYTPVSKHLQVPQSELKIENKIPPAFSLGSAS
ncbi:MAG: UDP-2,3-diacylglucosamine diphosphatase [Saprospiraceae bacterium]|nr:UDP-2,3-diacylglucosamine diphosphatase [Saprospiraceae bacterium]